MTTMLDALAALSDGPKLSGDVAAILWPGREFKGSANGGPTGGQRAAAGMLGRLKRRGLVRTIYRPGDPRTYWVITSDGRTFLSSNNKICSKP